MIIKILIKKFHSSFKKVNLDLEIAKDLINYYKKDSDCNKRAEIHQILKNEILFLNTNQIEEAKNDTIDITKVKNEIQFIKSVTQGNINISQTELNFILELFFYIKKKGSQIGHPNLEPEKNINLINEDN